MTSTVEDISGEALVRRAQQRLLVIGEMRDAIRLKQQGKSQREIAEILRTTQPRVGRLLRGAQALGETPTPEEIILRATVEGTHRGVLVKQLCAFNYTFTNSVPQTDEAARSGTWSQVSAAHRLGLLGDDEYESVRSAVNPPATAMVAIR